MCPPLLFGTAATTAGAAAAGGSLAMAMGGATTGRIGSAGVFAPLSGSIATGIGSAFSGMGRACAGMGAGGAFNLLSLGSSLYGTAQSTAVQQANLEYQAQMQEYNRKVAENNAGMARQSARYDADTYEQRLRALKSSQNVRFSKSGVVINQDTPLDVAADTAADGELERLAILYRGETEAGAYMAQAAGNTSAAARLRANADAAAASSNISMIKDVGQAGYRQYRNTPGTSLLS